MQIMLPAWLYWGSESAATETSKRKIFNTNLAILIAVISLTVYGALYLATGNSALFVSAISHLPFYAFFFLVPWLNRKKKANMASWLLCFSLTALIFNAMYIAQGSYLGVHSYFLLFAIAQPLFFPLERWGAILFFFLLDMSIFIFAEYIGFSPNPEIYKLASWQVIAFKYSFFISSIFFLFVVVWLSEYAASTNEARLERISDTDGLTGIANRRHFDRTFDIEWQRATRLGQSLAVALIDVDHFKKYNDYYGHQAGDECLQQVARALKNSLRRSSDLIARYGGEEFAFIAPNTDHITAAKIAGGALHCIRELRLPHEFSDFPYITVSIGVASIMPKRSDSSEFLLKCADEALYTAKREGRNRIFIKTQVGCFVAFDETTLTP